MHHEGEETANVLNGPIVLPPAPEIVQERKQQRVRKRGVESKFAQKGVWKKILSWNVNGARARRKDKIFFLMIKGYTQKPVIRRMKTFQKNFKKISNKFQINFK